MDSFRLVALDVGQGIAIVVQTARHALVYDTGPRIGDTIDFEIDNTEKDRKIATPLLILWGTRGAPPTDVYPTVWRRYASNLVDAQPLPTGHALQVEAPDRVYDHFVKFFRT